MGPPKSVRTISQEAFDEVVRENMEDLGMDPDEALQDAIQTLSLQGVDLSGIVKAVPGEGGVKENPVIRCLERLKQIDEEAESQFDGKGLDELVGLFDELKDLCGVEGPENAAIATKHGAVEFVCSICSKIPSGSVKVLVSCLRTMAALLHDIQSIEAFRSNGGPGLVVRILSNCSQDLSVLNSGFAVVAAASTGNEVVKQSFMELKIDMLVLKTLNGEYKSSVPTLYDAIRVLLTSDDNRVVASEVYGYARRFAKIGVDRALLNCLIEGMTSQVVSAGIALKTVAVNDEICKSIADVGGIDVLLKCIDDSSDQGNQTVARTCCALLSKLAGSDSNKCAIIEKGGLDRLIKLSQRFSDDPSILQEVMSLISVLCLRSSDNAVRAMEAGAGELAIQAMKMFPAAQQMQRSCCLMVRNLAVRNAENRVLLLSIGVDKLIRAAKENHDSCKAAASDALRDLGLDDYK